MEENNLFYYYLQDEMGSSLRVSEKEGEKDYLTYGYDEFGNDLGRELEEAGIPNPYSRQGEGQPFGYTGYRHDSISDTYFAQAREYRPETGRFTAEDVIKGNGLMPQTLNPYIYCRNNPLALVDLDGMEPEDYVSIYYVNNSEAAANMGHTAFLLVKENGMAEYYSYSTVSGQYLGKIFDVPNFGRGYEGKLFTNVSEEENPELIKQEELPIDEFIKDGKVNERWYSNGNWHERENGIGEDSFTRAIIIPITNEQGNKIHDAAQKMIDEGSTYNLWGNNCVQVARELISAGGEELVISRDSRWKEEYLLAGLLWNNSLVTDLDFIPNIDYAEAVVEAVYRGYEIIYVGPKDDAISQECITD